MQLKLPTPMVSESSSFCPPRTEQKLELTRCAATIVVDGVTTYERGTSAPARRPSQEEKLETVGSIPCRASMGHRPRRLFGRRRPLGLLSARPSPKPRLPLGGGWSAGHH